MTLGLRDYQSDIYKNARSALLENNAIAIQLHTGGGKTVIFTAMCESVYTKNKRAWIIVPRKELVRQASNHLRKWKVPHGIIAAGTNESRAYKIHVVSKDTLIRRYNKIKNWPDLLIFDECHLFLDRQLEISSHMPVTTKIIGYSATMERRDGRGLSKKAGGLYESLIEGPSIPWMTERNYLSDIRYFSPPIDGLADLKKRGTEYDEEELDELLKRRKIYGEVVGHYEKYGRGKSALIFCRSVKAAHQMAERFRDKGHNFVAIDGTMSGGTVNDILDAHRDGKIDGICNCMLVTYGVDIKRVEYIGDVSPTCSRPLYMQKVGRGLRPFKDEVTGYEKQDLIYMDHVNQVLEHQEDDYPGVPLHFVPKIEWNFHGTEKRKRNKDIKNIRSCPHLDFLYCQKPSCTNCEHNPDKSITDARKPMVIIDADLEEKVKPVKLADRPQEEKREFQDRINSAAMEYKTEMSPGAVGEMIKIADECGYGPMWVYHKLNDDSKLAVNVPLLSEIARQKDFKPGWVWYAKNKVKGKIA